MNIPETQKELLAYLSSITREVRHRPLSCYTTAEIARTLTISRNLASQYLNDLVRAGLVVKAGSRPVHYFHRRNLERLLHAELTDLSFTSVEALLSGTDDARSGFESIVGRNGSLARAIEQLRAAAKYPPHGLPVLMVGPYGSGKSYLARMMFEYSKDEGLIPSEARFVRIKCSDFGASERLLKGLEENGAWMGESCAGYLYLEDADALDEETLCRIDALLDSRHEGDGPLPHIVFSIMRDSKGTECRQLVQLAPMVVSIPAYKERPLEEREELALTCLRDEGQRMGADVYISRGALRRLADAAYPDNVYGLRAAVLQCCAEAYLGCRDNRLEIRTYQLPSSLISGGAVGYGERDDALIEVARNMESQEEARPVQLLDAMLAMYDLYRSGSLSETDLLDRLSAKRRDFEDYLSFEDPYIPARVAAWERLIGEVLDDVNGAYSTNLSKLSARLLAREIGLQLYSSASLARWKSAHGDELEGMLAVLKQQQGFATTVADGVADSLSSALGIEPDALTRLLFALHVFATQRQVSSRRCLGVILSHGYSTATSIADAANRILHARVFEAIDMPYDQQVKDVIGPLRQLVERFSYCDEMALLVDMGSLEDIDRGLGPLSNMTLGLINNASTGLAVEVGAGILSGKAIADILQSASELCTCRYRILEKSMRQEAVVFCSESGIDAAEKIRALVLQSFEREPSVRLIACDYQQLVTNGCEDAVFGEYNVRAIIGTADPNVSSVPYVALEDLIANEADGPVDRVLSHILDPKELSSFHQNMLKNMTLRNVVESITILNPDRLFSEIELAVDKLERLTGKKIDARSTIGLYVHLCCLVERLVTHNPIEAYADEDVFIEKNRVFIDAFRASFSDISTRYHVEVPVAEVAYVFDYITSRRVARKRAIDMNELESQQDE